MGLVDAYGRPIESDLLADCCQVCGRSFILDKRRYALMIRPDFLMDTRVHEAPGPDGSVRRWKVCHTIVPMEACTKVCAEPCAWTLATTGQRLNGPARTGWALAIAPANVHGQRLGA